MSSLDAAAAQLKSHFKLRHFVVGYSGGLDSHVLLHWLAQRQLSQQVSAIYIDHGLQSASAAWGEHCTAVCATLGIALRMVRTDARAARGESPEAAARRVRYAAFAAQVDVQTALLTAHHADDQAETLLLQLLRGSGVHGLAAMPSLARLGAGWLLRPFLGVPRNDLRAYAEAHGLQWIEDPSNQDSCFDRNYLRHQVLPLLQQRWPALQRTLGRSAQLCAETAACLDEIAAHDLNAAQGAQPNQLALSALRALSAARQRNVLRYWLRQLDLPVPEARQLQQLLHDALTAAQDRNPCLRWAGAQVQRYRRSLYALPAPAQHDAQFQHIWRIQDGKWPVLKLPGIGQLRMAQGLGQGLHPAVLASGALLVRLRRGGERFRPLGRAHSQELKKLLQEAGIPPWERARLPLIYQVPTTPTASSENERLLAVAGLGIGADSAVAPDAVGWLPVFQALEARPALAPPRAHLEACGGGDLVDS